MRKILYQTMTHRCPPQSATYDCTSQPHPQSQARTSTSNEVPSASQPRSQSSSVQAPRRQAPRNASQPATSQAPRRQPEKRKQASSSTSTQIPSVTSQQAWRPAGTSTSYQMPFAASQPVNKETPGPVRRETASQPMHTSQDHTQTSQTSKGPIFVGESIQCSNSVGPPISSQSLPSQPVQIPEKGSRQSRKQTMSASLSSRKR